VRLNRVESWGRSVPIIGATMPYTRMARIAAGIKRARETVGAGIE
jgi:hypothetical protein